MLKILNKKIIIFGIVAIVSAVLELIIYTVLFEVIGMGPVVSSPVAQIIAVWFNFLLNKLVTFGTGKKFRLREAVGYFLVWLINLFVTTILMAHLISVTAIYPTVVRFAVMVVMFFFNYLVLKNLVFRIQSLNK